MQRLSVLEPSLLHLPPSQWHDDALIAKFEQRWIDLIDTLVDARETGLDQRGIVSLALESLLWGAGSAPAWTSDRDAKQRLLSVFYQRLRPLMDTVDVEHTDGVSAVPALDARSRNDPWLVATLDILSWAAGQPGDLVVEVGIDGTAAQSTEVVTGATVRAVARTCHDYREFLMILPLEELTEQADATHLAKIVELAIRRFVASNADREQVYRVECSPCFGEQFARAEHSMKPRVVEAIVSRVTQSQKSAQADKGLKDEPLGGRDRWRRCRVTRDWRIHYSYPNSAAIRLETVGPHDLGL